MYSYAGQNFAHYMQEKCYHCGTNCDTSIPIEKKYFCCDGCKMVFQLLHVTINENEKRTF
jgi:predicted  nucleic acid-binding Zn ribbon protein